MIPHKGLDLGLERELRGISLESLSRDSRYSIAQLRDLEAGRLDRFPNDLVLRGLIRMYVDKLGLDHQMVMLEIRYRSGDYRNTHCDPGRKPLLFRFFKDLTLRPVAGFFVLTLCLLAFIRPLNDHVTKPESIRPSAFSVEDVPERAQVMSQMDAWSREGVALEWRPDPHDPIPSIHVSSGSVRLMVSAPAWIRIHEIERGIESLNSVFPGTVLEVEVKGEVEISSGDIASIRCFEADSNTEIPLPRSSVIRFLPYDNPYIIQ